MTDNRGTLAVAEIDRDKLVETAARALCWHDRPGELLDAADTSWHAFVPEAEAVLALVLPEVTREIRDQLTVPWISPFLGRLLDNFDAVARDDRRVAV